MFAGAVVGWIVGALLEGDGAVVGAYHSTARSGKVKVVGGVLLTSAWGAYYCVPLIASAVHLRTTHLPAALYFGMLNRAVRTSHCTLRHSH